MTVKWRKNSSYPSINYVKYSVGELTVMNSSMSNFVRLSLYDDIENYLSIPYHLDERTNFSERYPKQRDGIVTKGYSESLKQVS